MVKKLVQSIAVTALVLAGATACNQAGSPVVPAKAAVLHLTVPSRVQSLLFKNAPATITAQNAVPMSGQGALEYYLVTDGAAPVTGVLLFSDVSQIGSIYINLPKAGTWLVAAELFSVSVPSVGIRRPSAQLVLPGLNSTPEFVGADKVDIQGTTNFTLNMEQIYNQTEGTCYNGTLTDPTDCDYLLNSTWLDLYSFNTGTLSASVTLGTTGDIQALYDPVTTLSTYLSGSTTGATYAYLGNGDLVNYAFVPSGTAFYPDTLQAKGAVLGAASAGITVNDVFVIKGPESNQMVWFQPWINNNVCGVGGSTLMQFWFVYNNEGLDYMKFDETTNGHINCNQNTVPTSTPTPTATP